MRKSVRGFTIVELLIVIVVIAILAAITIVAYNGIQQRARDSQRSSDIATIIKALELYYVDNGQYPAAGGSTAINSGWSATTDGSWSTLKTALMPKYLSSLPSDPTNTTNADILTSGFGYAYLSTSGEKCNVNGYQWYRLIYRKETGAQTSNISGNCTSGSQFTAITVSENRVVKN